MRFIFFKSLVISLFCVFINSCSQWNSNKESVSLLQQAWQLVEQMPDSAMVLLDSISTSSFSDAEKADYTLLRIQAKDNTGQDLSNDTEIFQAREYFINEKDGEGKKALVCYYSAKVATAKKDTIIMAMGFYQEALDHVRKTEHKLLTGKILYNMGYLDFNRGWYPDAIVYYKQALSVFYLMGNQYRREIYALNAIGNSFLADERQDSAMIYYSLAMDKAKSQKDTEMQTIVLNNMGIGFRQQEYYNKALHYLTQAIHLHPQDHIKASIFENLVHTYLALNHTDSAKYYLAKAEDLVLNNPNTYSMSYLVYLCYQMEKQNGDYRKSLDNLELFLEYQMEAFEMKDRHALLEMQRKYDNAANENEHNKEISKMWKIAACMAILLLFLSTVYVQARITGMKQKIALAKVRQEKKNFELNLEKTEREKKEQELVLEKTEREKKEKELALEKAEREKVEKQLALEKEKQEKDALKKRGSEMQTAFLEKMDIIRGLVFSSQYLEESKTGVATHNFIKKMKPIISDLTLQKFMVIANELCPGLTDNLSTNLPRSLTKREIEVCCLIVCGFNNEEIAIFINKKKNTETVIKWKNIIRRKLGIEAYGNIQEFLLTKISIQ